MLDGLGGELSLFLGKIAGGELCGNYRRHYRGTQRRRTQGVFAHERLIVFR